MKNDTDIKDLVQSSIHDIEKFEKSVIWSDMKNILDDWNAGLKSDYDNADSMEDVKYLQGVSRCITYVLNLPSAMKSITDEDYKEE